MPPSLPDTYQQGDAWPGPFGHADTSDLLDLDTAFFSLQMLKEKRWCYTGIFHPDIIAGCAVIHLGYMAGAFAFGFDRQNRRMTEFSFVFPPFGQVRYDRNPEQGMCCYRSLFGKLILARDTAAGSSRMDVCLSSFQKKLTVDVDVIIPDSNFSPMNFLMPMANGKKAFTSKAAGLNAKGRIVLDKKTFHLTPDNTFVVIDWTNGFYPRQTFWNWACAAGRDDTGKRIGFNLSSGVYEYGLLENTVWIDGSPHETGPVDFIYDNKNPMRPWRIQSRDTRINLTFIPEGKRCAHDNLGLIKSRFIQPCGTFNGSVQIGQNTPIHFAGMGGVVEEHFAKW